MERYGKRATGAYAQPSEHRSTMTDETDESTSSNAVNQPWSVDRVYELANIGEGRSRRRGERFASVLQEKLPEDVQTGIMLSIAEEMAKMKNGADSVWIYTGHPENAAVKSSPNTPSIAVIERLGYPAYHYLEEFPAGQTVWAIAELYRHSPMCKPKHRNASSKRLESEVRDVIERYVVPVERR